MDGEAAAEDRAGAGAAEDRDDAGAAADSDGTGAELAPALPGPEGARLERLERTLAAVQDRLEGLAAQVRALSGEEALPAPGRPAAPLADLPAQFWALRHLRREAPAPGAVVYAGAVDVGLGHVEYQWARTTEDLLRADWSQRAERVGALGHPLRLAILRLLLDGERTVAQLVDELSLSSTGIAYHHLQPLQAAGWATSPQRGRWTIPAARVVPLLAIITALEDS